MTENFYCLFIQKKFGTDSDHQTFEKIFSTCCSLGFVCGWKFKFLMKVCENSFLEIIQI